MSSYLNQKYEFKAIYFPRMRELIKPSNFKKYVQEIKDSNADIFQFTGLQFDGFLSYCLAKRAKVKNICAIRGSQDEAVYVNPVLRFFGRFCEKRTLKGCDGCYAVSEYVASWPKVKKYAHNLFGSIYNFFDFGNRSEECSDIRSELGVDSNKVVVVSTGRVTVEKGLKTVRDIILCGEKWNNVCFVIVGDGNYKDEFERDIKENGMEDKVRFLGYRKDVSSILEASDIFLSCTMHETFGNSILEGSYHGLPVVATNVGGVPEIIDDKKTGFLVENGNTDGFVKALKTLVADKELCKKMGDDGRQYVVNKFSEKNIGEKLDKLYQSFL
jgi:glycosyltransferase involved in cell wall biosynthesis